MMNPILFILFISSLIQISRADDDGENQQCSPVDIAKGTCVVSPAMTAKTPQSDTSKCSIYMAESTIPGAGYGVFTARDIPKEGFFGNSGGPAISITDMYFHNGGDPDWAQVNYFWSGDGYTAIESEETAEMTVNIGALSNYHTYLTNIDHWAGEYDDDIFDRFQDPGAGAISYFRGHQFTSTRYIEAGEELFADYGEDWLTSRGEAFEEVVRYNDFEKAGKIMAKLYHGWKKGKMEDLDYDVSRMVHSIVSVVDERVASVLPKKKKEFEKLFAFMDENSDKREKVGKYPPQKMIERELAYSTTNKRNATWLEENGMCLDNLVSRRSTLEQAGNGAFAQRHLSKGETIVPIPLLLLTERSALNMYNLTRDDDGQLTPVDDTVVGKQLLLNYCFSHKYTTAIVCPSTNVILVNHCSTRRSWGGDCGSKGPNAELKWAFWDKTTEPWLDSTIEEMTEQLRDDKRGLSMELIALRDIQPDEEVTIDYGIEWEKAYFKHIANWKPPKNGSGFENYASVHKMNEEHNAPYKTLVEQDDDPYPANARTMCYKLYDEHDDPLDTSSLTDDDILPFPNEVSDIEAEDIDFFGIRNSDDLSLIDSDAPNQLVTDGSLNVDDKISSGSGWYWPCQVLTRKENNESYVVRILHSAADSQIGWVTSRKARILYNFPARSIKFANKSYMSDQFLPGAFRHHIGLSDEMLPEKWKNIF